MKHIFLIYSLFILLIAFSQAQENDFYKFFPDPSRTYWYIDYSDFWINISSAYLSEQDVKAQLEVLTLVGYLTKNLLWSLEQTIKNNSNTANIVYFLQYIFWNCEKYGEPLYKNTCRNILDSYLWRKYIVSKITLLDIKKEIEIKDWIYRWIEYSDLDENFPLVDHFYFTVRSEVWVGDYLFWIWDAFKPWDTDEYQRLTFDGIAILKAWDTHWQKFITIDIWEDVKYNINYYPRAISIKNGEIYVLIIKKDEVNWFLAYDFQLQQNGERNKIWCYSIKNVDEVLSYGHSPSYETYKTKWLKKTDLSKCSSTSGSILLSFLHQYP